MNILVAGIHGVGKTYLASQSAESSGLLYTSASTLIREERLKVTWDRDKNVKEIDKNQVALASAVARHNEMGNRLLLDGHFVLFNENGSITLIEAAVFEDLRLGGVILVESDSQTIREHLEKRDERRWSVERVELLKNAEKDHAKEVCKALNLKLVVLLSPSVGEFAEALSSIMRNGSS